MFYTPLYSRVGAKSDHMINGIFLGCLYDTMLVHLLWSMCDVHTCNLVIVNTTEQTMIAV